MKNYNLVYLTTNLINGKQYLGKHSTDNLDDGYLGSGTVLKRALKKYGNQCFKREILAFCETEQEAFEKEYELGVIFDILNKDFYNLSFGGRGGYEKVPWNKGLKTGQIPWNKGFTGFEGYWTNKKRDIETINKVRKGLVEYYKENDVWNKGLKGINIGWEKGKKRDDEFREKISKVLKEYYKTHDVWNKGLKTGQIPWNKNKVGVMPTPWNKGTKGEMKAWNKDIPMSESSKLKCSLNSSHSKSVLQFTVKGEFIKEYRNCKETGFNGVGYVCNKKQWHAGGFIWIYKKDFELDSNIVAERVELYNNRNIKKSRGRLGENACSKKVIQLDENKNKIKEFTSITEARLKMNGGSIGKACRTGCKAKGFYWKYKE